MQVSVTELYERLTAKREEFNRLALTHADYKQTITDDIGHETYRRPVVALKQDVPIARWDKRIKELQELADALHKADPERFPEDSLIIKAMPKLVRNVDRVVLHENIATDSKLVTVASIIKKLELAKRKLIAMPSENVVVSKSTQLKALEENIAFYQENKTRKIRSRSHAYTEVKAYIYSRDFEKPLEYRVGDAGLFLFAPKSARKLHVEIKAPNQKSVPLVYQHLQPLPLAIPHLGKLYWEDEAIKLRDNWDKDKLSELVKTQKPKLVPKTKK
ncbi:hypothetical protein [Photobacterium leiognathi]|uniref:hypothetical protein n=1 Tax=Photobacterium leiognathi TaxID=553611 RepID=UPI002981149F|nr:hypothetical protein [Photobacterium leiognathi]